MHTNSNSGNQEDKKINLKLRMQAAPRSRFWATLNYLRHNLEEGKFIKFLRDEVRDYIEARFYGYVLREINQQEDDIDIRLFAHQSYAKLQRWANEIENVTGVPSTLGMTAVKQESKSEFNSNTGEVQSLESSEDIKNGSDNLNRARNEVNKLESML